MKEYEFKNSKFIKQNHIWHIDLKVRKNKGKKELSLYKIDNDLWQEVIRLIINRMPKILYYENFLFDFPQRIYLGDESILSRQEVEYKKVLQDVLDSFDNGLNIKDHILDRLIGETTAEDDEALDTTLNDIAYKLTEIIFGNWSEVFVKDNKEIVLNKGSDPVKGYFIELKVKQGNAKYSINERSLGFRWFFSFLLFTEFRKSRKEDSGETLFLLDEPASNLHQKSQIKLLDVFEKLSKKSKIIYSTHSHYLINPKYLSGTYIIKNDAINYNNEQAFNNDKTNISATLYKKFASNNPNDKDHYRPILEAIHYVPGMLEVSNEMVFLEGKSDYYTFMYFHKNIFKDYNFKFYPGASVSKYEDMFRMNLALNKKFIAIFDSDTQGKREQRRYINSISIELEGAVFTLDQINSSWKNYNTEDLFTNNDKIKIIKIDFPECNKYDKSKFNTALQSLFINNNTLELDAGTINNFKTCFEFINQEFEN